MNEGTTQVSPAISVVIPNYDGLIHLSACLSALRAQTFQDFETILVDNGSRDRSVEFVRASFPEVIVVDLRMNRGFAGGVNAGVAVARGEFIALLNNDTEADCRWLEALHQAAREDSTYAMWASRVVLFERPQFLDSAGDGFTIAGVPFKRGHLEAVRNCQSNEEVFAPSGSAALFRKAVIDDVGSFDEDFFLIHEDVDFGLRARLRGHRCLYVADAIVKHKVNGSIGYMTRDYVFYGHRNLEYVFLKDLPLCVLIRCLPAHCLFNLFAFGHFLMRGRALSFVRAKLAALIDLTSVLRKRSSIQSRRVVSARVLFSQLARKWFSIKRPRAVKSQSVSIGEMTAEVRRQN